MDFVLLPSAAGCLLGRLSRERLHRPLSSLDNLLDMRVETPRLNVSTFVYTVLERNHDWGRRTWV